MWTLSEAGVMLFFSPVCTAMLCRFVGESSLSSQMPTDLNVDHASVCLDQRCFLQNTHPERNHVIHEHFLLKSQTVSVHFGSNPAGKCPRKTKAGLI